MSVIMDVADAVVTLLNEYEFASPFIAVRSYQPEYTLEHLKTLRVSVVPSGQVITTGTRTDDDYDLTIDIGVQKKVDPSVAADLDALTDLVEEIIDHLQATALAGDLGVTLLSIANEPIYALGHLEQERVFTSVLQLTYASRR